MGFLKMIVSIRSDLLPSIGYDKHTRLGTLILKISISILISIPVPRITVAAKKACNAFGINILPIYPKGSFLPSGGALLLFANHQVDFFSLDVLPDMPCGEAVFVLFFSASEIGNVRALWLLM
jgi:hypothetical protein